MSNHPSRRTLLKYGTAAAASAALGNFAFGQGKTGSHQRVVVIMFDGFDPRYLAASNMPVLGQWKREGMYKQVKGVMPSVTNANNASICCGAWPETHGIIANSYFD
jgi:phosphonoacetate hydrolase